MQKGDIVRAVAIRTVPNLLTEGKCYEVLEVFPAMGGPCPIREAVSIKADDGKLCYLHSYRFEVVENV